MTTLMLSRLQFATTTIYHFFFVPLTLGLSILLFVMELRYVRTGDEAYKRMVKFWGKLFLINFAVGVATGIVQEFQFGMNWSDYSRFVGDIFGAPLAIEALLAFFLESTFLGIWIFGWDKLSKGLHAATMGLVALGSNLSALWILIANSFMHEPVGYVLNNGRAEMSDFGALLTNPHLWMQFPHVFFAGITTAGFFVLGISAYRLLRKSQDQDLFLRSFRWAAVYALIGSVSVGLAGHAQGQRMFEVQPMKMAAVEGLWESADPAPYSLFSLNPAKEDSFNIEIPAALSFLAYNRFSGEVKGINELQVQYEQQYGPDNYIPPVFMSYWAFRIMFVPGLLMIAAALGALFLIFTKRLEPILSRSRGLWGWFVRLLPLAIILPYLANTGGWLLTELGRQPWIVYGLKKTADAVSPNLSPGMVLFSLIAFIVVYAALMAADIYLLVRYSRAAGDAEPSSY
ncbi:MAG: cytochrome ubiquinol oxidase subunit I [Anaerolineae bacterium]|nr:cytochrome ubiquinol oxidase subunit I [Anaerolineae bacterium]